MADRCEGCRNCRNLPTEQFHKLKLCTECLKVAEDAVEFVDQREPVWGVTCDRTDYLRDVFFRMYKPIRVT